MSTLQKNNVDAGSVGLFLFDCHRNVVVLKMNQPYPKSNKTSPSNTISRALVMCDFIEFESKKKKDDTEKTKAATENIFLEKIQIPRGKIQRKDQDKLSAAVREFIEETYICLDNIIVYHKPFLLEWFDEKWYKYEIFVGFVSIPFQRAVQVPVSDVECWNENKNRDVGYMTFENYKKWIRYQMLFYTTSNYEKFLMFIEGLNFKAKHFGWTHTSKKTIKDLRGTGDILINFYE